MIYSLIKTKRFIPSFTAPTIYDIDYKALYKMNKRGLMIDLDNTLITYKEATPTKEIIDFINDLKTIGFQVVLVSNNHKSRLEEFTKTLDVGYVGMALKPLSRGYKKALKWMDLSKDEVMMIGDQMLTDILGASFFGIDSILVKTIEERSQKWYTKLNRSTEKRILKRIYKQYPKSYQGIISVMQSDI